MRNSPLLPREQSGQSRMPLVFALVFLRGLKHIQPSTRLPPSGLSSHTRLGLLWAAPTTNHREPRCGEVERQECTQGRGSQVLKEMMWDPHLQPGGAPHTLAGEETGPPASPADTPQPRGQHGLVPRPLPRAPLPHPLTWGSSETQNGRTGCRDLTGHTSKVCERSRAVKDRAPQAGPCGPHMRCGFQSRDQLEELVAGSVDHKLPLVADMGALDSGCGGVGEGGEREGGEVGDAPHDFA